MAKDKKEVVKLPKVQTLSQRLAKMPLKKAIAINDQLATTQRATISAQSDTWVCETCGNAVEIGESCPKCDDFGGCK